MMTITSYIPGRIRVRDDRLGHETEAKQIIGMLQQLPGITSVSVNKRTASLLVQYDPSSGVEAILRSYCAELPQSATAVKRTGRRETSTRQKTSLPVPDLPITYRQFLNYGMMATFAVSGVGIVLHYRKLHALAGFLFFGLTGLHMYNKRKTLFV